MKWKAIKEFEVEQFTDTHTMNYVFVVTDAQTGKVIERIESDTMSGAKTLFSFRGYERIVGMVGDGVIERRSVKT